MSFFLSSFLSIILGSSMVKRLLISTWIILASLFSCSVEEINITCADPLGTDTEVMNNDSWTCFQEGINGCFRFELTSNPALMRSVYVTGHTYASIIDIGEVICLGDITQKPTSGWVYVVVPQLHHGYVVKMADGTLGRFFIDSWETGSGGVKTKINITRQYSF